MGKKFTWKHYLMLFGAAIAAALAFYADITGSNWKGLVYAGSCRALLLLLVSVSCLTVTMIDLVSNRLDDWDWAMRDPRRRILMQAVFGVVGVGIVVYGYKWVMLDWLADDVFGIRLGVVPWAMLLVLVCLVNLVMLYLKGVIEFKFNGATPKNAYLNRLLAMDGAVQAKEISYCYHYKHKVNRIRLRGNEQRSDPIIDETLGSMMQQLDPIEFFEARTGIIIHQSAIVDDGRPQPNGNRKLRLVQPYKRLNKKGEVIDVADFDVPKRKVAKFEKWRERYRLHQIGS